VVALLADQGTVMPLGFAVAEKLAAVQDERAVALVLHVGDLSYAGIDAAVPKLNISSVRPRAKARGNRRATASLFLCGRLAPYTLTPTTHAPTKNTALLKTTHMHKTLTHARVLLNHTMIGGVSLLSVWRAVLWCPTLGRRVRARVGSVAAPKPAYRIHAALHGRHR
jgi:hypothetical protein